MACGGAGRETRRVQRGAPQRRRTHPTQNNATTSRHGPLLQTVGRADSFSGAGRLVMSQLFDALYVCRAPSESCADLVVVGAFVPPAEYTSLQRS
jgi:hypothetical protein